MSQSSLIPCLQVMDDIIALTTAVSNLYAFVVEVNMQVFTESLQHQIQLLDGQIRCTIDFKVS